MRPIYRLMRKNLVYRLFTKYIHNKRQHYHLGWLDNSHVESLANHLHSSGWTEQPIAWLDPGETHSLSKRHMEVWQYHLRIFHDGEVRGHLEYAPEEYSWRHFFEINIQNRNTEFHSFLEEFSGFLPTSEEPGNTTSHNRPAASRGKPSNG